MKGWFCVEHWVLIMLNLMCEERSRSKCLTSCVIIREQPGWTNRKGPLQANNRRFSLRVFIIVSISLFLAGLGLCCCSGSSLVTVCGLLTVVSSLVKSMGYMVRGLQQLWHIGSMVVVHGFLSAGLIVVARRLSCFAACGILLDWGLNPHLLHWQAVSLPLSHQGRPQVSLD